jgi:hypothetical protein
MEASYGITELDPMTEVAFSNKQQSRSLSPFSWGWKHAVSKMCSSEYQTMDKVQTVSNPECYIPSSQVLELTKSFIICTFHQIINKMMKSRRMKQVGMYHASERSEMDTKFQSGNLMQRDHLGT